MKPKYKRLSVLALILCLLGGALTLTLLALEDSMMYFVTPEELLEKKEEMRDKQLRLGGLVKEGSLQTLPEPMKIAFTVTDGNCDMTVHYKGALPDLFREGQGIVALGIIGPDDCFHASQILAKHDETYMPKEVANALKEKGQWRE
jgi:cytochrome c-type biogenesis protein CcmE